MKNNHEDYVLVPKSELVKLEESRKLLYQLLEEQCNDCYFLSNLIGITQQMWTVANRKDWGK